MIQNSYQKCLEEMFGLRRFGIKLGLDVITSILNKLDNPQTSFRSIHIAGTNGKGSIAAAVSTILREAGHTVGLYTSPHLISFNERICINNHQISDEEVIMAHEAVKSVHAGTREPTFFEYTTAMAFYTFGKAKVDWAVIETGMGGRLDATNVLRPELSIISNISLEHRYYLGNSIAQIAYEKAGIIKQNTPVVTGAKNKNAADVFKRIAKEKSAPLYRLGKEFSVRRQKNDYFSYYGMKHIWKNLRPSLPGDHQVDNAAVVLAVCEILDEKNVRLGLDSIRKGIETFKWPGRLEMIPGTPQIIIDGAHNLMAARNLAKFLSEKMSGRKITMVIGILDDKPYVSMLKSLLPHAHRIIITQPKIDRGLSREKLKQAVQSLGGTAEIVHTVDQAVNLALDTTHRNDIVCITGSLYVVGEAKQALIDRGVVPS